MNLSLAKIRSFIAVAEHGSFRKASTHVHLSQPALSTHVRDLEQSLGIALLSRTTRSVRLTPAGEQFLIRARRAISELQSVVLELEDQAALRRGRVTVACVPTIASSSLPSVLAAFARRFPAIHVQLLDEVADTIYQRVRSGAADFGIGPEPRATGEIAFEPLVDDHFVAVFPRDHKLARRRNVRLRELAAYPFLSLAAGTNVRDILDRAFSAQGFALNPVYDVCHHYTLGGMVQAGLGISALPSMSLSILGHPGLKTARIVDPEVIRVIGVLRRPGELPTPAAAEFMNTLWDVLGEPKDAARLHGSVAAPLAAG